MEEDAVAATAGPLAPGGPTGSCEVESLGGGARSPEEDAALAGDRRLRFLGGDSCGCSLRSSLL